MAYSEFASSYYLGLLWGLVVVCLLFGGFWSSACFEYWDECRGGDLVKFGLVSLEDDGLDCEWLRRRVLVQSSSSPLFVDIFRFLAGFLDTSGESD